MERFMWQAGSQSLMVMLKDSLYLQFLDYGLFFWASLRDCNGTLTQILISLCRSRLDIFVVTRNESQTLIENGWLLNIGLLECQG